MAFHVSDPETDEAVRRLADLKGTTLVEAIRDAVEREYDRQRRLTGLDATIKAFQEEFRQMRRPGGLPADKAFFDELSGDI